MGNCIYDDMTLNRKDISFDLSINSIGIVTARIKHVPTNVVIVAKYDEHNPMIEERMIGRLEAIVRFVERAQKDAENNKDSDINN